MTDREWDHFKERFEELQERFEKAPELDIAELEVGFAARTAAATQYIRNYGASTQAALDRQCSEAMQRLELFKVSGTHRKQEALRSANDLQAEQSRIEKQVAETSQRNIPTRPALEKKIP